jgi:hypothetical protein
VKSVVAATSLRGPFVMVRTEVKTGEVPFDRLLFVEVVRAITQTVAVVLVLVLVLVVKVVSNHFLLAFSSSSSDPFFVAFGYSLPKRILCSNFLNFYEEVKWK